jgi:hypothetical protein
MNTPHQVTRSRRRRLRAAGLLSGALVALIIPAAASAASADTVTSSNWSGYAAHGGGTKFTYVSAHWRMPAAACTEGEESYSSFWVGIGGYSLSSDALEQTGTELDCNSDGSESLSAWYELLPDGPHTISMTVRAGDLVAASVRIIGHRVTFTVRDLTRHETAAKTLTATTTDETSAEWIAEAPSNCTTDTDCTVLPLADFGAVRFANATTTTSAGTTGAISTGRWTTTKLLLGYEKEDNAYVARSSASTAAPTALSNADTQFEVRWTGSSSSSTTTVGSGSSGTGSGPASGGGDGAPGAPGGGLTGPGGPGFGGRRVSGAA